MSSYPLVVPHLRACAWFAEEPVALAPGCDRSLEVGWGKPDVAFVEPMLRRRLSPMAKGFFHCGARLSPPGDVRVVFASRHGEGERTLAILQELAAEREVSPALFSMSVHNAVPGLWSILQGNRAACSALAAGPDTFGWGLVEAIATWMAEPALPLLYVYADDRLPEPWARAAAQPGLHAVALLLGGDQGPALALSHEPAQEGEVSAVPPSHHFLAAWQGGATCWDGPGGRWRWEIT